MALLNERTSVGVKGANGSNETVQHVSRGEGVGGAEC